VQLNLTTAEKAAASEFGNVEPAGGQQQDRIGLFVSVRGVFIEQV